jgi:SAM-dependent methyltransferase
MSDLGYYVSLLEDVRRVQAFAAAIREVVRPGDHVVEVGCGIGTYSLLAAQAGARRVSAIDRNPVALALARELNVEGLSGGVVRLIESAAELVDLEDPADVVIFEDFGSLGFRPGYRNLLEHVRERLAKPETRYVPSSVELFLAPTDTPVRTIGMEESDAIPFPPEALALLRKRALNDPTLRPVAPGQLLSEGIRVGRLRLGDAVPLRFSCQARATATRSGPATGLAGWMRVRPTETRTLDNSPWETQGSWKVEVYPFERPLPLRQEESFEAGLEVAHFPGAQGEVRRWWIRGSSEGREASTVNAIPGDRTELSRGSVDHVPQPGPRLPQALQALGAVDGQRSVAEIAQVLYNLADPRFSDLGLAQDWLVNLLERVRGIATR